MVQTNLHNFFTENDFPNSNQRRPDSWHEMVVALRGEMATHPVILSAAHLFSIEINILDWQGVKAKQKAYYFCYIFSIHLQHAPQIKLNLLSICYMSHVTGLKNFINL